MGSSRTTVQFSARKVLSAEEVEANAKLERRQLDMLAMHALKISGGDLSFLVSPAAVGKYKEQFVALDAAAVRVHNKGYRSSKNPLKSRHAYSVAQDVMSTGVIRQGSVKDLGLPFVVKDNYAAIENFILIPLEIGSLPCPVLFVANPKVRLSGKLSEDALNKLLYLTAVISKRRKARLDVNRVSNTSDSLNDCELTIRRLRLESRHAIVTISAEGHISSLNPAAAKLFSCKPRKAIGEDFSRYLSPKYFMPTLQSLRQAKHESNETQRLRLNHRSVSVLDESGDVKSVATSAYYSVKNNQVFVTFVFSHPSVIRRSLLGEKSIANLVDTGSGNDALGVLEFDSDWQCEGVNNGWSQISGLSEEASQGMGWTQAIHEDDLMEAWISLSEITSPSQTYSRVWRAKHSDGSVRKIAVNACAVVNELNHTTGYLFVCQDVSGEYQAKERLHHAATHDALTGLLNRSEFLGQLQVCLNRRGQRSNVSLLILKLDGIRTLNENLGQGVGDEALRQFSQRLQASAGHDTKLGRVDGIAFAVCLHNYAGRNSAAQAISKILTFSNEEFNVYGHVVSLKVSVGYAAANSHTDSSDDLFAQAYRALNHTRKDTPRRRLKKAAKACDRDFSKTEFLSTVEPKSDDCTIVSSTRTSLANASCNPASLDTALIRQLCQRDEILELS